MMAGKVKNIMGNERGMTIVEILLYTTVIAGVVYVTATQLGGSIKGGGSSLGSGISKQMGSTNWTS